MNCVRQSRRVLLSALTLTAIFVVTSASVGLAQTSIALRIEEPTVAWGESQLAEKLMYELNSLNGLEISRVSGPLSDNTGDYQWESGLVSSSLLNSWGHDRGHRFVVVFTHLQTDLSVKKGLSIPLALSRYRVIGEISGKLKIYDTERGKLVVDQEFSVKKNGPGSWQLLEDNPHSGKLSIPATEKPAFLESLEWKTATKLASILRKKMRLR